MVSESILGIRMNTSKGPEGRLKTVERAPGPWLQILWTLRVDKLMSERTTVSGLHFRAVIPN